MTKFGTFYVCFCLTLLCHANEGARILGILPVSSRSHFIFTNAVMKSLIEAGHKVTLITPFKEIVSKENYTKIISVPLMKKYGTGQTKYDELVQQNAIKMMNFMTENEHEFCTYVMNLPEIEEILKSDGRLYDIVFVEIISLYQCYLPVAKKMKVPVIGLVPYKTSAVADNAIYNPHNPNYVTYEVLTRKWKLKSIIGRIFNACSDLMILLYINFVLPQEIGKFHQKHADQLVNFREYMNTELELVFYNNYAPLLSRPMNTNAIDIGGIHVESVKPLPNNIQNFIDEADQGVILFSLGSLVRGASLSIEMQNAFKEAFAEVPQRVIWKFEEKIDNLSNKVLLLDWLPQRDILEHKNVIVFITHCGLGGTIEAIHTATAVVACPLFADQYENAELLEDRQVAVRLDIDDISKESVLDALNKIINETKYSENMLKLSKAFKERSLTPQQQVVYWTEYVIRNNGTSSLKSAASRSIWFQHLLLDVVLVVLISLVSVVYVLRRIGKFFYSFFTRVCKNKNKSE